MHTAFQLAASSHPTIGAALVLSSALPIGIALLLRAGWVRGEPRQPGAWVPKGEVWWVHWVYYYAYVVVLGPMFLCVVGLLGVLLLISQLGAR
jgi:hypothetical protein